MTSKLTREQLHERARENVKALKMASRQTAFESAREEILADLQLAELALAAMESEPVAFTEKHEISNMHATGIYLRAWPADRARNAVEGYTIPLYLHAQPAPVVPEEATPDSIEILASARRRDHAVFKWDEDQRNAAADSWNAFRAAMLQELKKSAGTEAICRSDENVQVLHTKSPAQSDCCPAQNQGWIPVSERMPEVGVKVLCFPVKDEPIHATFNGQLWLQDISWSGSDEPIDNVIPTSVTHWMPLPAAPQEVRGE